MITAEEGASLPEEVWQELFNYLLANARVIKISKAKMTS